MSVYRVALLLESAHGCRYRELTAEEVALSPEEFYARFIGPALAALAADEAAAATAESVAAPVA